MPNALIPGALRRAATNVRPRGIPRLNPQWGQGAGLTDCYVFLDGGRALNLGSNNAPTYHGMGGGLSPWGVGGYGTGGNYVTLPFQNNCNGSLGWTYRFLVYPVSWPGNFAAWIDNSSRDPIALFADTSGVYDFGVVAGATTAPTLPAKVMADVVFTGMGGLPFTELQYLNGKQVTSTSWSNAAGSIFDLGANTSGGGANPDMIYLLVQGWQRTLSAADVLDLYQNPWDFGIWPDSVMLALSSGSMAPTQPYGGTFDLPTFAPRRPFHAMQFGQEQWPFTATATPTQFGWDNPERLPQRRRFRPLTLQDEQWPFTAAVTPTQTGWDNPERFSQRVRFRPARSAEEQWPLTVAATPTAFGWDWNPQFPARGRFRPIISDDAPLFVKLGTLTPSDLDWAYEPQFPFRRRFQPSRSADEQWPFTVVKTAGPFGWNVEPQFPSRIRFRPLIYDGFQPNVPPAQAQYQVMAATATKVRTLVGATEFVVTLAGSGAFVMVPTFSNGLFSEALPFGSAQVVLTSGMAPQSVQLGVSNDGVNFVQVGPALLTFPNLICLTGPGATSSVLQGTRPTLYHAWIVQGGDATTVLTITEIFVGWRG